MIIQGKFKQSCILSTYAGPEFLYKIIKRASYVLSCGTLIYACPMDQASLDDARSAIARFVCDDEIGSFDLSFYTREKFGSEDVELNGLLIDQKRIFLGELQFEYVRRQLERWSGPGQMEKHANVDARFWVYNDVASDPSIFSSWIYPEKEDEIYLIVYRCLYRSKNALYDLDMAREAKPYWKGIDTTPQRLMGAMLNLAQVQEDQNQVVLEPFSHTGSLVHEAAKLDLGKIIYNDKFETIGTKDNLGLLTAPTDNLRSTINKMRELAGREDRGDTEISYRQIRAVARQSLGWQGDEPYPEMQSVRNLQEKHGWLKAMAPRLLFYIVRRFCVEHHIGYDNGHPGESRYFYGGFKSEAERLIRLEEFLDDRLTCLEKYAATREEIGAEVKTRGIMYIGYDPIAQNKCQQLVEGTDIDIAKNGIPLNDNSVDAIITDPPYGYGSAEEQVAIYNLYRQFFSEAFRVLKPGGRVAVCVLDKVRTGKKIMPELFTAGVVDLANDIARESRASFVVDSLRPFGRDDRILSYWKAQHKLNRGILSFQIHK